MDLILINEHKLKVVLTAEDMTAYALTCDTIDYDNTETKRAFWDILDTAKHRTGFDAASDRVFIQAYPGRDGGCELYVTKLHRDPSLSPVPADAQCRVAREKRSLYPRCRAFVFVNVRFLLAACRLLRHGGHPGVSSAFTDPDGKYYLFLECTDVPPAVHEFGSVVSAETVRTYLAEHGKCICEGDAIERLGSLA